MATRSVVITAPDICMYISIILLYAVSKYCEMSYSIEKALY